MIKTFNKLGLKGNFLNLIKGIYKKPTATLYLLGKKWKLYLKIRNKAKMSILTTSSQHD